jgi:DmsE family decaheme c-type cytochrome
MSMRSSTRSIDAASRVMRVALALGFVLVTSGRLAAADPPKAPPAASDYIGAAKCRTCHEVQAKGYTESPHARGWDERAPAADRGCETCHGPGRLHVEDVGASGRLRNFKKIAPRDVSETCMTCHNREEHTNWQGGMHDARNVTCVNCHSVHTPKSEKGHLRGETVVATCAPCHREKVAKLQRSGHMPVREGKMDCSSCHNQHGSTNVRMLRAGNTVNEFCASCHSEKRGPFLWDHAPVRESCITCHDPHGSGNDRMLVAKAPMLCQRCHVGTGHPVRPYDGVALTASSNRLVGRGCVNCHSNIHGSNHPSGQFFQR